MYICISFDTRVIQESVELAKNYFKHISYPFFHFLENNPLKETHDIADASLFVIMALEETRWCIPTPACSLMSPSSCPVAVSLSKLYHFRSRCSNRGGANIPRRIEIASRIAACRITLQSAQLIQCVVGMDQSVIELTRSNLRNMGVCSSEASDLCMFFKMVNVSFGGKHIEMCLDSTGQRVVFFTHWDLHPDRYSKIQRSDGHISSPFEHCICMSLIDVSLFDRKKMSRVKILHQHVESFIYIFVKKKKSLREFIT